MKDYYNILGIKKNATFYDVTEAYRELSVQYHPDNHNGDEEYVQKYNDVQEAYETLSNGIKRREYDNYIIHVEKTVKEKNENAIPSIEYFKTDKTEFEWGEEVVFTWKTVNADSVNLVPFGSVQPVGSFSHVIKNYKKKLISFELIAENTSNGRETKASVSLKNKNYDELFNHFKNEVESQYKPTPSKLKELEKPIQPIVSEEKKIEKKPEIFSKNTKSEVVANTEKPKTPVKKSEDSENNILLFIVILFLVIGFAILIYLGFFM